MITQNIFNRFDASMDIYAHKKTSPQLQTAHLVFKFFLLIANFVLFIFGIVLVAVGSYALNVHVAVLTGNSLPAGIIVMGVFTMFVSLLGGISAFKESRIGLAVYLTFLCLIAIIVFAVGIAVYVNRQNATSYMISGWQDASYDVRYSLENVYTCCGLDYNYTLIQPNTSLTSSPYIFTYAAQTCPKGANGYVPCLPDLESTFSNAMTQAGAVGIAFGIIMGALIFFVACLIDGIRKRQIQAYLEEIGQNIATAGAAIPTDYDMPSSLRPDPIESDHRERERYSRDREKETSQKSEKVEKSIAIEEEQEEEEGASKEREQAHLRNSF